MAPADMFLLFLYCYYIPNLSNAENVKNRHCHTIMKPKFNCEGPTGINTYENREQPEQGYMNMCCPIYNCVNKLSYV
jgi:hypothetical protein